MRTVKPKGKAIDINKYINTGYDKVVLVADNMEMLTKLTLILDDNGFKNVVAHLNDIVVVANSITNVVTVSGIADDVVVVANNISDVVVVSHNIEDIKLVAEHIQAVQRVADSANNVDKLVLSADALDIVATSVVSVDKVAASIDAVESVSSILSSVVRVSASADNVDIVANDIDAIKAVPTYMTEIRQAVNTTTTNAQTSTANAASALASKDAASASEIAANASKVASKASQDAAKMSELAAYSSELSSLASAEASEASKTAAKAAETNAIANSTSSYNYSELARGYANAAEVSKGESIQAASDSSTSASASLSSANAAKVSEDAAKASQVASKASETASKASENASKASELAAKTSETTAIAKATQTAADAVKTGNDVVQSAANAALAEAAKEDSLAIAATLTGGIIDKGAWDASTGVFPAKPTRPLPEGGTALVSAFWKVTVAGTAGGISFLVGDDLRFSASTDSFYKVDNTDAVASVQGKTGAVTLSASEVGALSTPTGTFSIGKVILAGYTAGTAQYSPYTLSKSVPPNAVFTDTVYTHPTTDGDLHVPATGTTNNGKALVAGATAGSATWKALVTSDIGGLAVALDAKLDATANAVSATKLQNTVTINGVAFDGSANITINAASPFTLTRGTGLTGANYNGAAATTWAVAYGTAAGTACQGNDARLSDARTPVAHSHGVADVTGLQGILDSKYSSGNTNIGTGASNYAAGNHTHTPSQVGLGNVPNTVHSEAATASTVAVRDASGDIACRLLRPTFANDATMSGALAYRVNNTTDNYVRFCSDTSAIRTWLGAAAASHTHPWAQITGVPVQATRWPTPLEINAAQSGGFKQTGGGHAISTSEFINWVKSVGGISTNQWSCKMTWNYANNNFINDTGVGNIQLAGATITTWGNEGAYTIEVIAAPASSVGGNRLNARYIYQNHGEEYAPAWVRYFDTSNPPTPTEIGAQPAGSYAAASHTHDYLPLAGGVITGTLTAKIGANSGFTLAANSTGFSELVYVTGAGSNEWNTGLRCYSGADWRVGTQPIYHTGNKPTAADVGAAPTNHTHAYAPLTGAGTSGTWPISISGTSAACSGNSATATLASTVVVNGSADNNFYDMLWRSGNTVYAANSSKATLNPATGDMRLGGHVSFAYTSDENLKIGIREIDSPLAKVCCLRTATYLKRSILEGEDGKFTYTPETGFIAQDLEKVIPDLIQNNDHGYKTIKGGGFEIEALLAGAIKELKKQHDEEIAALKEQIAALMKLI